jgi:hypothetical protein
MAGGDKKTFLAVAVFLWYASLPLTSTKTSRNIKHHRSFPPATKAQLTPMTNTLIVAMSTLHTHAIKNLKLS